MLFAKESLTACTLSEAQTNAALFSALDSWIEKRTNLFGIVKDPGEIMLPLTMRLE